MTEPIALTQTEPTPLTRKDFVSDQEVKWCPGCGDFAILAAVQKVMPTLGVPKEKFVFVSGIGCSSRFPYYMDTYGFHGIHGRALPIATGLKCARPDLSVWVVTGDGDALAIGGNHFMHTLRRNLDINVLLFNNRIYGLTKGQYSPTSKLGMKTKTTPNGSIETPVNCLSLALSSEASFIARAVDVQVGNLGETLKKAADHKGISFVEIYQNCVIFNDRAFSSFTDKSVRDDQILILEDGKPMIFGAQRNKGIRLNNRNLEVVTIGENDISEEDLLVHNEHDEDPGIAFMLTRMEPPAFPVAVGVFRSVERPTYNALLEEQMKKAQKGKRADIMALLGGSETWHVR